MLERQGEKKMKTLTVVLIVISVTVAVQSSPVGAQNASMMNADVSDARSAAMGGTAIVSATGSNAIFFNPAIIATLE
jgi:hypothetical protein